MIALALSLLTLFPQAQQEVLKVNGPHPATLSLGTTSEVEIVIEGPSGRTRRPEVPEVPGLQFQLISLGTNSSIQFLGGRMHVSSQAKYLLRIQPTTIGEFTIPPIRVYTGTKWQETPELRLEVFKDLEGENMGFLEITPSATRVYVHEPLSFIVDFGVNDGLAIHQESTRNMRYLDIQVQAPWLSDLEAGEPLAVEDPQESVPVVLNRTLQQAVHQEGYERDGRMYNRFLFEKAFLPNRLGHFELDAPVMVASIQVGRRVGPFGSVVPGRIEQFPVYGEPISIEVLPIPEEGRPVPYYGAVGRFQVAASLDKQQARVGSSVKLTLTITGTGNFEFLRVPELDQLSGFHLLGQTQNREKGQLEITYDLTPLDASVAEMPSISWNHFDTTPGVERFVEVATEPMPISVLPLEDGESLVPLLGVEDESVVPGVDDIFDIKIVDPAVSPMGGIPVVHPRMLSLVAAMVFGPWLLMGLLGLGLRFRRRRAADVVGQRARSAARSFQRELRAGGDPAAAMVTYLAARLGIAEAAVIGPDLATRLEEAGVSAPLARETQQKVEVGIAARYGGGGGLDQATVEKLVERLEAEAGMKMPGLAGALLLALLVCGAPLFGQEPSAAYRSGDYASAATAYGELAASDPDRRHYYNLGNALFRQGHLARALWAYESARLALPRDRELLANIGLVKTRLDLTSVEGEPFLDALLALRNSVTSRERLLFCGLCNLLVAGLLLLAWGHRPLRTAGLILLAPALLLVADVLWLGPSERPTGIVLQDRVALVSEPRLGLDPVFTLRSGVSVAVLGEGSAWTRVEVRDRTGYLPTEAVGVVR